MHPQGLLYTEDTRWQNVFETWFEREGQREEWSTLAKQKGWASWREWRSAWVAHIGAEGRTWKRYEILDPVQSVPHFLIGPTQSWQQHFVDAEKNTHTFATLVDRVSYEQNEKVQAILEQFPQPTEFIGVLLHDKRIMVIEGHHRATALALAKKEQRNLHIVIPPTIVLTECAEKDKILLDVMLQKGSARPS